jgi:hypothetical protein
MSYDYLLVRGMPDPEMAAVLGDLDEETAGLISVWGAAMSNAIGPVEEVRSAIDRIFPKLKWERSAATLPSALTKESPITDWSWGALGGPELTLGLGEDGHVHAITMSYASLAQVKRLAKVMGLRALDEQSLEIFGG